MLAWFNGETSRVVAAVMLSLCWVVIYYRFVPFARADDQLLAETVNIEILFTTILLVCSQGALISNNAVGALCVGVNLVLIPIILFLQLRNAKRGWKVVNSLEPGRQISEAFEEEWFMRCWEAGGSTRQLIRKKTVAWIEQALQTPIDEQTCHSILRVLQLPPFQCIESFGEDGMGIVVALEEEGTPSFSVLTFSALTVVEDRGRSTYHGPPSSMGSGNQPLLSINVQQHPEPAMNARLTFVNASRRDIEARHTSGEFAVEIRGGQRAQFETVLFYVLQTLVEARQTQSLLEYELDRATHQVTPNSLRMKQTACDSRFHVRFTRFGIRPSFLRTS